VCSGYACVKAAQWAYAAGADLFAETTADNVDGFLRGALPSTEAVRRPTLAEVKREYVHRVVLESGGNRSAAASVLGIRRQSLQRMLKREPKRRSD
jgi:ActR/RegA family two-component response regulator